MKKLVCLFLILLVSSCFILNDALAKEHTSGNTQLNQLLKNLEKGGVSQKDLKNVNKQLENLLNKGGNKNDIGNVILRMNKHGVSGGGLEDAIKQWNDLINAGDSNQNAIKVLTTAIDQGKSKQAKGNDLAALIQNALQQRKNGLGGFGNNMAVNDILRTLQNNGVNQKDLKGIDKQLRNILNRGGNKDVMQGLLLDMVQKGVTGTYLMDSVASWNDVVNAGVSNQRTHDVIANVLSEAKAKGLKDKELADAISVALRKEKSGYGYGGNNASLNELIGILQKNGVTQNDVKGIDKQLGNILNRGGNKEIMQRLLLDMVQKGVTGTYLMDSVNSWNNAINGGVSNQKAHDIIAQVLGDAKNKGVKDKQLAELIQNALRQQSLGHGATRR